MQDQNLLSRPAKRGPWKTVLLLLLLIAAAGSAYPHWAARRLPAPGFPADAIFVLSGGENRIPEAFRIWKEGKGKDLYILGARGGAKIEKILPGPGRRDLTVDELRRLHVEGWSENTMENAFSAKGVIADKGYRRVILVTSDYHVPRAYYAFRVVLPPGVELGVMPVSSEWNDRASFPRTLRHFLLEGWKYWGYRVFLWEG